MTCNMGYNLQKVILAFVNVFYLIISVCLITIATYYYISPKVHATKIAVGLIFVGVSLFVLSILGIYGAIKHSQPALFFYSLFMIFVFIAQYALAIASLAAAHRNLVPVIKDMWQRLDDETKVIVMDYYQCCPLDKHRRRVAERRGPRFGFHYIFCCAKGLVVAQPKFPLPATLRAGLQHEHPRHAEPVQGL